MLATLPVAADQHMASASVRASSARSAAAASAARISPCSAFAAAVSTAAALAGEMAAISAAIADAISARAPVVAGALSCHSRARASASSRRNTSSAARATRSPSNSSSAASWVSAAPSAPPSTPTPAAFTMAARSCSTASGVHAAGSPAILIACASSCVARSLSRATCSCSACSKTATHSPCPPRRARSAALAPAAFSSHHCAPIEMSSLHTSVRPAPAAACSAVSLSRSPLSDAERIDATGLRRGGTLEPALRRGRRALFSATSSASASPARAAEKRLTMAAIVLRVVRPWRRLWRAKQQAGRAQSLRVSGTKATT
eukprot:495673-Prymnesium_polylepis.1